MLLCCKFLCPEGLTPYSNSSHRAYWHAPPLPPMPCLPVWWLHNALQTALSTTRHPSHAHPSPSWPSTQSCSWPAMLSQTLALAKSKSKKILFTVWLLVSGVVVSPVSAAGGWALSPDEGNSGYPSVAVMVGGATCSGWCCTWSSGVGGWHLGDDLGRGPALTIGLCHRGGGPWWGLLTCVDRWSCECFTHCEEMFVTPQGIKERGITCHRN